MSKIEENKARKRRAILNAAERVFLAEGYGAASMDRIAAESAVTKQTIYRYFPGKSELFSATLAQMGEQQDDDYLQALADPDPAEALRRFALAFIHSHLTEQHLALQRLLISESAKAPELTALFFAAGPDEMEIQLNAFFRSRLGVAEPGLLASQWTAMLLHFRDGVLLGQPRPTDDVIEQYAASASQLLLRALP